MSRHTETPWSNAETMIFKGGENVILVDCSSVANAEHIVRCVNSHDALVEALEEITRLCANPLTQTMGTERKDLLLGIDKVFTIGRTALKLAKEQI